MLIAKNENPVDGAKDCENEVAHKRLASRARSARFSIDHEHSYACAKEKWNQGNQSINDLSKKPVRHTPTSVPIWRWGEVSSIVRAFRLTPSDGALRLS